MQLIRLGAATLNQTPMDWQGNHTRIVAAIAEAKSLGVGLLCLPELCVTGYGCEDMLLSPALRRRALEGLLELAPHTRGIAVAVGLPLEVGSGNFNAQAMLVDGALVGLVCKQHLANEGLHYEPRWFQPWPAGAVAEIAVGGERVPVGDLLFDLGGVRVGIEICRDAWVAERTGISLAKRGADVLLNPNASHFAFGKENLRQRFVVEGSRTLGVAVAHCNLLGNEAGRAIYDGETLIAAHGKLVAAGRRFSYADHELLSATIDLGMIRQNHRRWLRGAGGEAAAMDDAGLVRASFAWPEVVGSLATPSLERPCNAGDAVWNLGSTAKEEEFARAVALGLFDYLRKSRARGFVVSLSGGVDSAAVASLCSLMVRFASQQLGMQGFTARLPHLATLGALADAHANSRDVLRELLTCVYQATENSGQVTRGAAAQVAEALGATHYQWDVQPMVDAYRGVVEQALGRKLDWASDDIALQNVQARARGPGAWMLANLRGALLLTTSNRSEASVGYATMDGDTCGGLAPVAGVDKAFLRHWLVWMETKGPVGIGPLEALKAVNVQAPTAELRPPDSHQTDEADLMPYDVLDVIEQHAIRDKRPPVEVWRLVCGQFRKLDPEDLRVWTARFFRLWSTNQWKRERYAPALHVDEGNVDPKTWCRFPILSGGFTQELAELEEAPSPQTYQPNKYPLDTQLGD